MDILQLILAAGLGYLLGAIPSGLILTRLAGLGDIRSIGSGNIGATNVLRTGNKALAAATLALDVLKGVAAVALGHTLFAGAATPPGIDTGHVAGHVAGLAAFLGHLFPVWLGFRGGKGVATYIGVVAALAWPLALVFCGVWLAVAGVWRYSSLSALVAAAIVPLAAILWSSGTTAMILIIMSMLLISKHHANIRRLMEGQEPKIGSAS
jgi:glycerol-3-phosphate acyltransferase PlsY